MDTETAEALNAILFESFRDDVRVVAEGLRSSVRRWTGRRAGFLLAEHAHADHLPWNDAVASGLRHAHVDPFLSRGLGLGVVSTSGDGDGSDWVWLHGSGVDLMLNTAYEADARPALPDPARGSPFRHCAVLCVSRAR
jgi:hypothetical protein